MSERSEARIAHVRHRVDPKAVLRNLRTILHGLGDVDADTALLAGYLDHLDAPPNGRTGGLMTAALMALGDDYAAGFRDGFDSAQPSRKMTRSYVEGLEDGGVVAKLVGSGRSSRKAE